MKYSIEFDRTYSYHMNGDEESVYYKVVDNKGNLIKNFLTKPQAEKLVKELQGY